MIHTAVADERVPGPDRRRRRCGPDGVDAAGAPGGRASARQRASGDVRSAEGARAQSAGDGGAGGRGRGGSDRGAQHARGADGGDGVLRRLRRVPIPTTGAVLARLEWWGAGGEDESWRAASPWRQHEPAADPSRAAAQGACGGALPGPDPVRSRTDRPRAGRRRRARAIRDNASGREYTVSSEYLIGADGGRRSPGLIGVEYEGLGVVTQTATLHVSADFSRWAKDPDVLIRWIFSPQAGVLVVMVPMGPEHWGPESEEWVIHLNYPVDSASRTRRSKPTSATRSGSASTRWRSTRSRAGRWTRCSPPRSGWDACSCSATPRTATRRRAGWG